MKKYPEEKIITILKEVEAGAKVAETCRKYGISDATYYNWKSKYDGLELSELKRLKSLEEEKQIAIADMTAAGATSLLHNAAVNGDAISGLISKDIQDVINNYKGNINELLQLNGEQLEKIFGKNTKFVNYRLAKKYKKLPIPTKKIQLK